MEKLLNKGNIWDHNVESHTKEGPVCVIANEEVIRAFNKMSHGKATSQSGVLSEMLEASGLAREGWLTDLCNSVIQERKIQEDWR